MNPTTEHLIERPYAQVVDDILTSLVGGIVNEPIIFDVKSDAYPLAQPALSVRSVTGNIQDGDVTVSHTFQQNIDFEYDPDANLIVWLESGQKPADETQFFVDYLLPDTVSPITDTNVGSVARTLSEAVGREIATLYEQLNRAYLFGFIDTAEGTALDLVVSILNVKRKKGDFAVGLATFFRDPESSGDVNITAGTVLVANKGAAEFETTQLRTLQRGQARIDAPIRARTGFEGELGRIDAAAITELARPLAGISRVTNFEPTFLGAADETDEELRVRAKAALRALGTATLAALEDAVRESLAKTLEIWDPDNPPARRAPVGTVAMLVDEVEPERFPGLAGAVNRVRAAGIVTTLLARYVFFTPRVVASIQGGLTAAGKLKLAEEIVAAVDAVIQPLSSGDPAVGADVLGAIKALDEVTDATIVDVNTARSDVRPPEPESLVDTLVEFMGDAPTEETELRQALQALLFEQSVGVPSGDRIPDRSLLRNADDSGPATDADIEAGEFQVIATVDGEPYWVVSAMTTTDIALIEGT